MAVLGLVLLIEEGARCVSAGQPVSASSSARVEA